MKSKRRKHQEHQTFDGLLPQKVFYYPPGDCYGVKLHCEGYSPNAVLLYSNGFVTPFTLAPDEPVGSCKGIRVEVQK